MRIRASLLALAALLLVAGPARADRRAYGVTYEAVTAAQGELDVEMWTTYAPAGEVSDGPASEGVREMIELEYGITDRWDVALYNMIDFTSGDTDSGYAGFKLETRFRPTFRGEWIVDPVFYFEFQQLFRGDAEQKFETKLILARDFSRLNVSLNLALEVEHKEDGEVKPEGEFALGTSYEIVPALRAGAEVFGKVESEDGVMETFAWAGPCLSVAAGSSGVLRGIWATLAGGAGITEESTDYYGRLIVGLQF